jgi:hypothetical protein
LGRPPPAQVKKKNMTLTIELTPDQEARLKAEASAAGIAPESVLQGLVEALPDADAEKPKTGAEAVAYWERERLFNPEYGDPNLDSPEMARAIREGRYPPRNEADKSEGKAA